MNYRRGLVRVMKIHFVSDTHLESWRVQPPYMGRWPGDASVTVLAGDISNGAQGVNWAARQARIRNQRVIYVPGNHEFYGHDLPTLRAALRDRAKSLPEVILLDDDTAVIDGVRFVGATLWTDYLGDTGNLGQNMARAAVGLMDHYRIRNNGSGLFRPADALRLHRASRGFIEAELARPFDGPTVVVTHHCPSMRCNHPGFGSDSLAPAFCSNLDDVIRTYQPAVWICGHTHAPVDFQIGVTRVVNNPVGYPGELAANQHNLAPNVIDV